MILWHWRCLQETKRTFYAKSPFVYVANLADQIKGLPLSMSSFTLTLFLFHMPRRARFTGRPWPPPLWIVQSHDPDASADTYLLHDERGVIGNSKTRFSKKSVQMHSGVCRILTLYVMQKNRGFWSAFPKNSFHFVSMAHFTYLQGSATVAFVVLCFFCWSRTDERSLLE